MDIMKSKGCNYGYYNKLSYRICYGLTEDGKMDYSKELYEFTKYCNCDYCKRRFKLERGVNNHITITTDNKNKFSEIEKIINNWECKSEKEEKRKYIKL